VLIRFHTSRGVGFGLILRKTTIPVRYGSVFWQAPKPGRISSDGHTRWDTC